MVWCSHFIHLCRYLANGQTDSSFGNNGVVALQNTWVKGNSLLLYDDGRIAVAGLTNAPLTEPIYTFVARLKHDGTPDSTFSQDGYFKQFIHGLLADGTEPIDMALLNDELLVGFLDSPVGPNLTFGVFCLTVDGELNQDFGQNGIFSYLDDYPILTYRINRITLSESKQSLYLSGTYRLLGHDNMMVCKLNISGKNPTNIVEFTTSLDVSIYPNPVNGGFFHIDLHHIKEQNGMQLYVRDVVGNTCIEKGFKNDENEAIVDISNLPNGLYFVQLNGQSKRYIGKIMVHN